MKNLVLFGVLTGKIMLEFLFLNMLILIKMKKKIQKLLNELKEFNGMPFPKKIDDKFNAVSEYKKKQLSDQVLGRKSFKERFLKCFLILFLALAGLMKYLVKD